MLVHVQLVGKAGDTLELHLWWDNPNEPQVRALATQDIADLLHLSETDYYGPLPARLEEVGKRLYDWLDGGERWLTAAIEEARGRTAALVLAIGTPHGLSHLPWEVLHDGSGFLVHALNPVLPLRWRPAGGGQARTPQNRPLHVIFMAASVEGVRPALDYEQEEAAILSATSRAPLELFVEESGNLQELGALFGDHQPGHFDVLHLSGHADHGAHGPTFLLEDPEGGRADTTAVDLAQALRERPPLVFLSGCRTGQSAAHGEIRSLAESLLEAGFSCVLGWGRPVLDREATQAARHLYAALAEGRSLPEALVRTHAALRAEQVRGWHLLRLFCSGTPPDGLVTPLRTPGRRTYLRQAAEADFLNPLTLQVKVATRANFVGRRRLLQRSLRRLRQTMGGQVGLLLQGQGGRGKSSLAARLCARLKPGAQRVVVLGQLDETSFINAWAATLPDQAQRRKLRDPDLELEYRIESTLEWLANAGKAQPLFVLDDFERNQSDVPHGTLRVSAQAAAVLMTLLEVLARLRWGRVIVTGRYGLPEPFTRFLHRETVPPLDAKEQSKQALRQQSMRNPLDPEPLQRAWATADGNPRLFEWLHTVLTQEGLDRAGILAAMEQVAERFRENVLARCLISRLPEDSRALLGQLLLLDVPVPLAAVHALGLARSDGVLLQELEHAADLSLIDIAEEDGVPHYRVPRQLGGGDPALLVVPDGETRALHCARAFDVLYKIWWIEAAKLSETRILELIKLASLGDRNEKIEILSKWLRDRWLGTYREIVPSLEPLLNSVGQDPKPLIGIDLVKQEDYDELICISKLELFPLIIQINSYQQSISSSQITHCVATATRIRDDA